MRIRQCSYPHKYWAILCIYWAILCLAPFSVLPDRDYLVSDRDSTLVWPSFSRLFPPSRLKTRLDGSRTWAPHFRRDPGRSDRYGCQQQVALAESPVVSARRDDVDDRTCGRGSAQTRPFRRAESIAGCQDRCIIIGHPAQDGTDPSGVEAPRLLRRRVHRHARSLSSR